jgi:hypothetical protein
VEVRRKLRWRIKPALSDIRASRLPAYMREKAKRHIMAATDNMEQPEGLDSSDVASSL